MNLWEEKRFRGAVGDFRLYYCGKRLHNIGHGFGPYDRDDYLIYYIKEGRAQLSLGGERRTLRAGQVFVNFPHSGCIYTTEEGEPWSIKWFSADGPQLADHLALLGLTPSSPVLSLSSPKEVEAVFDEMFEQFDRDTLAAELSCMALLYRFLSLLAPSAAETGREPRILQADALIDGHFAEADFGVARLAAMLGLHHNYFSVLYKRETGVTPVRAIAERRLQEAGKMLRFTDRPIKEVAFACGFSDELYFSRAFRSRYGISPTAYRRTEGFPI